MVGATYGQGSLSAGP